MQIINNNHDTQQTQINNLINTMGGGEAITNAQLELINTQLNNLNTQSTTNSTNINNITNNLLPLKSDLTYVDTQLALKSDKTTTYTKTETDNLLNNKANQSTTYTSLS